MIVNYVFSFSYDKGLGETGLDTPLHTMKQSSSVHLFSDSNRPMVDC